MKAVLVLGSNSQDRRENIAQAMKWLETVSSICSRSSYYETPDMTGRGAQYGNTVAEIDFTGNREELNLLLKNYEIECGRDAECRLRHLVPIDIDIVIQDGQIMRERDYNASYFKKGFYEIFNYVAE